MAWNYGATTDFNPSGVMDQANTCENMIYIVITGVKEELHGLGTALKSRDFIIY